MSVTGKLEKAVKLSGISVTKGARAAIEAAGGSITGEPPKRERAAQPVKAPAEPPKQSKKATKQPGEQAGTQAG